MNEVLNIKTIGNRRWAYCNDEPFEPSRLMCAMNLAGVRKFELARELGVAVSTLSRFEKGESCPSIEQIEKMAKNLNVFISFLFGCEFQEIELPF